MADQRGGGSRRTTPPVARSPIAPPPPVAVVDGWEVSQRRSAAALTLSDQSALAKVLVLADPDSSYAAAASAGFGRAAHLGGGVIEVGSGVGEWMLLGPVGSAGSLTSLARSRAADGLVSVIDLTHGRALVRLTGERARAVLSKVCGIDLSDGVTPNLTAFRSIVAKLVTDVVRDDRDARPSYLLHCERSSGQYLFDVLVGAGTDLGLEVAGFDQSST